MGYLDQDSQLTGNLLRDHWQGLYELPRAYWINNILIANISAGALYFLGEAIQESSQSLRIAALVAMLVAIAVLAIWAWGVVGVWRAADKHPSNGGSPFWAGIAKGLVVLGAFGVAGQLITAMPGHLETAQLAIDQDSLGEAVQVTIRGNTLRVEGPLAQGSAMRVETVLTANPQTARVVLSSIGGREFEGRRIGQLIRVRGLDTHVEQTCESACTIALLAGNRRTAAFGSKVGFHQPSFPGVSPEQHKQMVDELRRSYREVGLPYLFVRRAMDTPSDGMWYPTEIELFEAGVLTEMDRERVIADQKVSADQINMSVPQALDSITELLEAKADGMKLIYKYRISVDSNEIDVGYFKKNMQTHLKSELCDIPLINKLMEAGATYEMIYTDQSGRAFSKLSFDNCR